MRLVSIRVSDENVAKFGLAPTLNGKCLMVASGLSEPGNLCPVGYKEHGKIVTTVFEQEQG